MRSARTNDHWRRVYAREYIVNISNLKFNNIAGVGEGTIDFNGGITALCGANGVGKSTLLNAVLSVLKPKEFQNSVSYTRLLGSVLDAQITTSKGAINQSLCFRDGIIDASVIEEDIGVEVIMIDPSSNCYEQVKFYRSMSNMEELLDGYEPIISTEAEMKQISYIVGKEYTSCRTYEIEDIGEYGVIPYFQVSTLNGIYGTETMGLGELSAHQIIWQLKRCSKNSIILIEEPESFLAPKSQEALLNVIAKYVEEKGGWVILSTHSPNILERIPIDHIRLLTRVGDRVQVMTPNSRDAHLTSFGVAPQKSSVLLVEDKFAREFIKILLSYYDPFLIQKIDILEAGDESKLKSIIRVFPKSSWLKIIGVFDGDMRSFKEVCKWPYTFLPANVAPEQILKEEALQNINLLSSLLGKSEDLVSIILSSLEGLDHHDWFIELQHKLSVSYEQLIFTLFKVWINKSKNNEIALDVYIKINGLINED
ncbi:ATP-dependent nuclease [Paenibacillus illinoisensis]|uniref:AAA ATPase n=1 Tax=Paenibacillus illinoisensis TaxID=59845 RepID=A0A2W0C5D6_9BACL|nr:AAA family ATPase [Paenibacillus illinoisensis]PYY27074.1 AAA ATPase [Paenibacillus illinoisensis]